MIRVQRRNLVLIGMMGSGKTTIGRHIARRLGRPFADTDRIIRIEAGCSIPELFDKHGEASFRDLESAVIERVAAVPNQIIAVGGGAVCRPSNVEALRSTGDLVLLDAPVSQLATRVSRGTARQSRPLLAREIGEPDPPGRGDGVDEPAQTDEVFERLHRLWRQRRALYEAAAIHRVDAGHRPPAAIADEIVAWMNAQLASSDT